MPSKNSRSGSTQALHFVLVHGAGHGAWCWYKIRTLLEDSGHKVTCIDLKCSGIDRTDFNTVFKFADYNEPLTTFMSKLPSNEKVVLVGHSAGGRNVTNILYKFPEKLHMVIYVAAMMFKFLNLTSTSTDEDSKKYMELGSVGSYELIFGPGPLHITGIQIKPELRGKVLYNQSPTEDSTLASMLLRPAPFWALGLPEFVEPSPGVDSVPRVYVKTMKDKLFDPKDQETMINLWKPSKVLEATKSDHSPFFSTPDELFLLFKEAVASLDI